MDVSRTSHVDDLIVDKLEERASDYWDEFYQLHANNVRTACTTLSPAPSAHSSVQPRTRGTRRTRRTRPVVHWQFYKDRHWFSVEFGRHLEAKSVFLEVGYGDSNRLQ